MRGSVRFLHTRAAVPLSEEGTMSQTRQSPQLREAIYELHRYFSDEMAPMMVADSVQLLLRQPPQLVATEIQGWVGNQSTRQGADFVVSDFLFHAMKKIHLLSEFVRRVSYVVE